LGDSDAHFHPDRCPVVSCDLTECELDEIGAGVATGNLSTACYFDSLATPANEDFKARVARRLGLGHKVSSFIAGAYATVRLCAEAIGSAGTDEPAAVRQVLYAGPIETVLGPLRIDACNNHAALPFHLGRITDLNTFEVVTSRPAIAADPYLTGERSKPSAPQLRAVS
jgi:branched-chain amino acid transport system substrate-binding protein